MDCTPEALHEEIQGAIKARKTRTEGIESLVRQYMGQSSSDVTTDRPVHENIAYEFVTNFLPTVAFGDPRFAASTTALGDNDDQLDRERAALNTWAARVKLKKIARRLALDASLGFGVAIITLEKAPGQDDTLPSPWLWPMVKRIPPWMSVIDPAALGPDDGRYIGHEWVADLQELIDATDEEGNPVFDHEAIRSAVIDSGPDETNARYEQRRRLGQEKKQVRGYEIYMPEKHAIYTIGSGQSAPVYLRPPRRAFCQPNPHGPYVIFGLGESPDDPYPISPLQASRGRIDELNAHSEKTSNDAKKASRKVLFDSKQKALGEAFTTGRNHTAIGIEGFDKSAFEVVEYGGPQAATLEYMALCRDRLDRLLGVSDTMRQQPESGVTATAEAIAERSGNKRMDQARSVFRSQVAEIADRALWLMRSHNGVRFSVKVPGKPGEPESSGLYVGGIREGMLGPEDDTTITVEPLTMELVDDPVRQARMQAAVQITTDLIGQSLSMPWLNTRNLVADLMEAQNISGAGDRYIKWEVLETMQAGGSMAAPAPAGTAASAEPAPRSSRPGRQTRQEPPEVSRLLAEAAR